MSAAEFAIDNPFWSFSIRTYRAAGVAPVCLDLQERHNVDVNLLLFCLWVGAERGAQLTPTDLAAAERAVADWHSRVVRKLRAARQWMKEQPIAGWSEAADLRERIKREELAAERVEQAILHAWAETHLGEFVDADRAARREAAANNCALFLAASGPEGETGARVALLAALDPRDTPSP